MAVKTITITTEAYEAIRRMKQERESFSDLFLRIGKKPLTAKDIRGIFHKTPAEVEDIQERIRKMREEFSEGMQRRLDDVRARLKRRHRTPR